VNITGITLANNGFIYVFLDLTNRTIYPTFMDVRQGVRLTFNGTSALSTTFSNMSHYTNYSLYYYASNDDPSEF
jgi:hypothetical protein